MNTSNESTQTAQSSSDPLNFARFVPGFDFLQTMAQQAQAAQTQFAQAAAGEAPKAGNTNPFATMPSMTGLPDMSQWLVQSLDEQEIDKRIKDLKAVQFWLEQNGKALAASIQALEVQKMSLAMFKNMQSMGATAAQNNATNNEAHSRAHASAHAQTTPPHLSPQALADMTQWWQALLQQFQGIAQNTLKDNAAHWQQWQESAQASTPSTTASTNQAADSPRPRKRGKKTA